MDIPVLPAPLNGFTLIGYFCDYPEQPCIGRQEDINHLRGVIANIVAAAITDQ
jgi:hypothetical protein